MVELLRIVNPEGVVSDKCYELDEEQTDKNSINLVESSTKTKVVGVHLNRIRSNSDYKKAVVVLNGKKTVGICPTCKFQGPLTEDKFNCPDHGEFELAGETPNVLEEQITSKLKKVGTMADPDTTAEAVATKETPAPAVKAPVAKEETGKTEAKAKTEAKPAKKKSSKKGVPIPFDKLKALGHFYTKGQIAFGYNNAKTDVQAHTLILENPLRKVSFNSYNGSLGKKSKDFGAEVNLEEIINYKKGEDIPNKIMHLCKDGDLEKEIKSLTNKGYTKQ